MAWVLFAVICGAMVYAARVIADYLDFERNTLLRIGELQTSAGDLQREVDAEKESRDEVRARIPDLRDVVSKLPDKVAALKDQVEDVEKIRKRIELRVNKDRLKESRVR